MEKYLCIIQPGNKLTMSVAVPLLHLLCLFAPFCFSWDAFAIAFGLYILTGLGITVAYHRNLSHKSFKLHKWLEYFIAYWGVQALQGDPIGWVSNHRYHHRYTDSKKDPHSPIQEFWFSHMGWLYDSKSAIARREELTNVADLENQAFYKFIQKTYIIHPIMLGAFLFSLGGFPYIVWCMGVRIVIVAQATFLVNSVCHMWGHQAWNTGDLSKNNWVVALIALGEGWHNNHHAFEHSARHGLEWWQFDISWCTIWALQKLGFATNVKLPSDAQKRKMAFGNIDDPKLSGDGFLQLPPLK
ncbi:unnamed protein product [Cuscuta europaea]|uniref:Fatty acid desaturase domain-containing protein n=1 Tax=Cuscuta europaea TaxID=41803 RepID=A0A9P1EKJ6_CUSEU|nr:unnamed protein product [Cuscuta europaea]